MSEAKNLLEAPVGTVVMVKRSTLTVHRLAKRMPMLPDDAPECEAMRTSIELYGLDRQPLIINPGYEIMDGRHRERNAGKVGLVEVPCMVRPDAEAASIIIDSLVGRRHYTKGARAYLAAPLLIAAAEANKEARSERLLKGVLLRNPIQSGFGKTEEEFAEQLGFSADLARQAKDVHRRFAAADKRLREWRDKYPDLAEWEKAIRAGQETEPLPDYADPYPEDYRAEYEPKILTGKRGLGEVIRAIAGSESTKGKVKGTSDDAQLMLDGFKAVQVRFARWEKLPDEQRLIITAAVPDFVRSIPPELRSIIAQQLLAKS